jgi:hypothetical protein
MEALGPVLILVSIPLILRWIPQNRLYGLRIASTLRKESVWYDANALIARHFLLLGLVLVGLEFVVSPANRIPVLSIVAGIGVTGITIADWRTANRWERERQDGP